MVVEVAAAVEVVVVIVVAVVVVIVVAVVVALNLVSLEKKSRTHDLIRFDLQMIVWLPAPPVHP